MTDDGDSFVEKIAQALEKIDACNISKEPDSFVWHFDISQGIKSFHFTLKPKGSSLTPLPYLYIDTSKTPVWGYPHTGGDGAVCAFDRQGLDYDPDDYELILRELVNKSVEIVSRNKDFSESERLIAFSDELGEYLIGAGITSVTLDGEILQGSDAVSALVFNERKGLKRIERINSVETIEGCSVEKFYVLEVSIDQLPPISDKNIHTNWWNNLSERLSAKQKHILEEKRCRGVILKVPNQYGGTFILVYWGNGERGKKMELFRLDPAYHEYLTQRVGEKSLDHKVAIIGVGSVGSRIAEHLVLSGVKELTLVDSDIMTVDNLGRHVLSRHYVGLNKAACLAKHLEGRMPGVQINAHHNSLESWLEKNDPNNYDVLVLAIGSPAEERNTLRTAWKENWHCRIVLTFVEAANLGGHAIAFQPGKTGCLECLYDPESGQLRTSMLKYGQNPSQAISSCGSFTPYSAITATRTALLAAELSLPGALLGYHRWTGEESSAKKLELEPSQFWQLLSAGKVPAFIETEKFHRRDCTCCNN